MMLKCYYTIILLAGLNAAIISAQTCEPAPDSFLPFANDPYRLFSEMHNRNVDYELMSTPLPYAAFGNKASSSRFIQYHFGTVCMIATGSADPTRDCGAGTRWCVHPMYIFTDGVTELALRDRVGRLHFHYTNDETELKMIQNFLCRDYTGAFVATYWCVAPNSTWEVASYQVVVAYDSSERITLIVNYGQANGVIFSIAAAQHYVLEPARLVITDEPVVPPGSVFIYDITDANTLQTLQLLEPRLPIQPCNRTCEIYANGTVKTFSGNFISDVLTSGQNYVATVDGEHDDSNTDPCKFALKVHTSNKNQVLTNKIEFAFGVRSGGNEADFHARTDFILSRNGLKLWDATQTGNGVSVDPVNDVPLTVDENDANNVINVVIDVANATLGPWTIQSLVCDYHVTFWWDGADPRVTLTLIGDRYDGRMNGTCAL